MTIITAIITVLLIILLHLWWYITSFFCTFHTGCELNSVRLPSDYPECLQHLDYKYLPNSDLSTFDLKGRVNLDWNCSWSLDTGESTRHDSVLFSFTSAWSWSLVRCSVKILALNPTINIRLRMMLNSSIPLSFRLIPELIRKITSAVVRLDSRIKFSIIWKLGIMLGLTGKIVTGCLCGMQYELVSSWAFELGWPSSHNCASSCAADSTNDDKSVMSTQQFYEGSFLRVLFDKLSRMLHQVWSVQTDGYCKNLFLNYLFH